MNAIHLGLFMAYRYAASNLACHISSGVFGFFLDDGVFNQAAALFNGIQRNKLKATVPELWKINFFKFSGSFFTLINHLW